MQVIVTCPYFDRKDTNTDYSVIQNYMMSTEDIVLKVLLQENPIHPFILNCSSVLFMVRHYT